MTTTFVQTLAIITSIIISFILSNVMVTGTFNQTDTGEIKLSSERVQELLVNVLKDYNHRILPSEHGEPVDINVDIFIADLEVSFQYIKFDVYFRRFWRDYRLSIRHLLEPEIRNKTIQKMMFPSLFQKRIWYPEVLFRNNYRVTLDSIPNEVTGMTITADGDLLLSERYLIEFYCPMDMSSYPFDHQQCRFEIESYIYNNKSVNMNWSKNEKTGLELIKSRDPLIPSLVNFQFERLEVSKERKKTSYFHQDHDVLIIVVNLSRNIGAVIGDQFLPAAMAVVFSWVGFWVDYRSVPARTSLGIVTVLNIITLISGTNKGSTSTLLDRYVLVCLIFVFFGFIEYILINITEPMSKSVKKKSEKTREKRKFESFNIILPFTSFKSTNQQPLFDQTTYRNQQHDLPTNQHRESQAKTKGNTKRKCCSKTDDVPFLDSVSRVLFPTTFFIFNIVYVCIAIIFVSDADHITIERHSN